MISKDYAAWHIIKINLNKPRTSQVFFREGEIWWASIGCNVGFEEDGKDTLFVRPVLILRKFNPDFFYGVPLSTTSKIGKYYYRLLNRTDTALLSQLRAFDARRLLNPSGRVTDEDFYGIRQSIINLI